MTEGRWNGRMAPVPKRSLLLLFVGVTLFAPSLIARTRPATRPGTTPTFSLEVSRIFQQHCQVCHRDGGIAPFSLEDYRSARTRAGMIQYVTEERTMPPWHAAEGCGEFRNVRRLTDRQIQIIGEWVAAGTPEGDPSMLPPPLEFPSGWALGEPDLEVQTVGTFTPEASGDSWRCYVMPHDVEQDTYLNAFDFLPVSVGDVHHMIAYVDTSGRAEELDALDEEEGYDYSSYGLGFEPAGFIGVFTIGERVFHLPDDVAIRLAAGSRIVIQVHYHTHGGHVTPDQPKVGLYFSDEPVRRTLNFESILNADLYLPAGDPSVLVTASEVITEPITIYSMGGHMHYLGREFDVYATMPNGSTDCLLQIDDWDQRWQGMYEYATPVRIPAGSLIEARAVYDNSASNPNNPHSPPVDIHWGESAEQEMMIAYLTYTRDSEDLTIDPSVPE